MKSFLSGFVFLQQQLTGKYKVVAREQEWREDEDMWLLIALLTLEICLLLVVRIYDLSYCLRLVFILLC
jgi:hypothetical protein